MSQPDLQGPQASTSTRRGGALVAARLLQVAGTLLVLFGLLCLLFAASPGNTGDAAALIVGAGETGGLGMIALLLGWRLASIG